MNLRFSTIAVAVSVVCVVAVAATVFAGTTTLVVSDGNGTDLAMFPVHDGSEVTIEYTHSVEKTLVSDVYRVSDGALVDDRMLFSSFGAGLPSEADVEREDDRYVYYPPEQRYERLSVSTGPVADHDLIVDGERHDLHALADDGTVQFRIESSPRFAHVT
ncbi:MAG: DUF1850 domain-containing protein [Halobacteriota archaeon]|uniref:DUF1850 domain-containing protein n=1 Tax=Natronomonas sp. TaxID=2184060 RepID=UPI00397523A5